MSDAAFKEWKDRARNVPIEDELARRGIHLKGRKEHPGPCPKCGGHDRFSFNSVERLWICRRCDEGGDVIDLVQHLDGVDFIAACETLTNEPPPQSNGNGAAEPQAHKVEAAEFIYKDENSKPLFGVKRLSTEMPMELLLSRMASAKRHSCNSVRTAMGDRFLALRVSALSRIDCQSY